MDHEERYHMNMSPGGDDTDVVTTDMMDTISMDNMTINLESESEKFSLSESDFYALNVPPLNINNDDDAKRWEELMKEEAESEVVVTKTPVKTFAELLFGKMPSNEELIKKEAEMEMMIIPQKTLSQLWWEDQGDEDLFSEDEDEINLMDEINPITGRKRVKIVDSDEESDEESDANKKVQLAPKVAIDLTEEVKKAKADLEGTTDESKTKKARQVTRWCFTMNNPLISGDDLAEKLKKTENVKGFVFQLEEGANGTEHFQGYVELKRSERMTKVKELIGENPHMEAAEGKKESNLKYCTKEEGRKEGPWIWGTCTEKKGQGKRTDLDDFARAVFEAGEVTEEIEEMFPGHAMQFARQAKAISADRAMREAKKAQKEYWMQVVKDEEEGKKTQGQLQIHNRLFFGPTAVGKTTMVMKMTMGKGLDLYTKAGWNKWFEGYKKEKHMLVDEFGTGFCDGKIENFNAMNNIGVNVQEVKGSHVLLHVTHAYFTTNKHPLDIWGEVKESGTYKAFIRRFAEVYWWNDKHELVILKNPGPKEEAEDEAKWKKECSRWYSFWNGKQLDDEHRTIVPGQAVKNYFTFGCNQPQTDIRSMF
uniref:Replication-associated protein n=1 Tax=Red panda feces-associated circular DNA virus 17 TaxID=2863970 RepID=A0A8K1HHA2_9VIRU|nr:replication-associated protein [Red panda feces-associated circular DNA virus 17]